MKALLSPWLSEVICPKSSCYSQYLFLFFNLARVLMGFGRLNIELLLISMRIFWELVRKRRALSSPFFGRLSYSEPLSFPILFWVSYRMQSSPAHVSMAWMKSSALFNAYVKVVTLLLIRGIWTFPGAIHYERWYRPFHPVNQGLRQLYNWISLHTPSSPPLLLVKHWQVNASLSLPHVCYLMGTK